MRSRSPEVDAFVRRAAQWQEEIRKLREILLECGLEEDLKWGKPCFAYAGSNLAIIQPFRKHCALLFFEGALLEDTHGLLRRQGPNSRSSRRLEFTSAAAIRKTVVKSYVRQAVAAKRAGRKVDVGATSALKLPNELTQALANDPRLAEAFHALTPGRQRGYAIHIADAKQAKTRHARVQRCTPGILAGKGWNDR